jgi:hypothetical protein
MGMISRKAMTCFVDRIRYDGGDVRPGERRGGEGVGEGDTGGWDVEIEQKGQGEVGEWDGSDIFYRGVEGVARWEGMAGEGAEVDGGVQVIAWVAAWLGGV